KEKKEKMLIYNFPHNFLYIKQLDTIWPLLFLGLNCVISKHQGGQLAREPQTTTATVGSAVTLFCTLTADQVAQGWTITWKEGEDFIYIGSTGANYNPTKYTVSGNANLQINDVTTEDAGVYQCRVYPKGGTPPFDKTAQLNIINSGGQLAIEPQTTTATVGSTVTLFCTLTADQVAQGWTITWKEGDDFIYVGSTGVNSNPTKYTISGNANLQINDVTTEDAGVYQCRVYPKGGTPPFDKTAKLNIINSGGQLARELQTTTTTSTTTISRTTTTTTPTTSSHSSSNITANALYTKSGLHITELLLYIVVPGIVAVVITFILLGLWYKCCYKRSNNKRYEAVNVDSLQVTSN
ncbi:unnamed protein product, partial [Owenia fusiformis]